MRTICSTCNGEKVVERNGRPALCWTCNGHGYVIDPGDGLAFSAERYEAPGHA